MESLSSGLSTPALIAALTAAFFILRAWPHLSRWNSKPRRHSKLNPSSHCIQPVSIQGVSKESEFPPDWWVGEHTFELERRAVFSKEWLLLSHRSRFVRVGDYQSLDVAGFPIFLILAKDGQVRAFHNVCRHRAYTVTKKESGSSAVLGCRYHGWSYDTFGQLIKAPHFDNVPGFERSQNSLFEISTVTNSLGFVFINLEASQTSSTIDTRLLDTFAHSNGLNSSSKWVGGKALVGEFNWKFGLRRKHLVETARLECDTARHNSMPLVMKLIDRFRRPSVSLYFAPMSSIYTIHGTECWYSLSIIPITSQKVSVRYDVYCYGNAVPTNCEVVSQALEQLLHDAIQGLEAEYQEYINGSGVSLRPDLDTNGIDIQKHILDQIKAHSRLEKVQGAEVFPAMRKPRDNTKFRQAEQLCKELDCLGNAGQNDLSW